MYIRRYNTHECEGEDEKEVENVPKRQQNANVYII